MARADALKRLWQLLCMVEELIAARTQSKSFSSSILLCLPFGMTSLSNLIRQSMAYIRPIGQRAIDYRFDEAWPISSACVYHNTVDQ